MTQAPPTSSTGRKRVQLDREGILEAATRLAAAGAPITFRALGSALGADPTAVYRHFRDKDELVRAVYDRLVVAMLDELDTTGSWQAQLRDLARLTLDMCEEHPSVGIEARSLITGGPGELAAIERILTLFSQAGLGRDQTVRFYAVYSSYLLSIAATAAAARLDGEGDENPNWIGDLARVDPSRHPTVADLRSELAELRDREIYLMGVDVLLEAAAAAVGEQPGPADGHR